MAMQETREERLARFRKKFAGRESQPRESRNSGHAVAAFMGAVSQGREDGVKEALKPLHARMVVNLER